MVLEAFSDNLAAVQQHGCAVDFTILTPWCADKQACAAVVNFLCEGFNIFHDIVNESGLEDQVIRRVADDDHFGEDDEVRLALMFRVNILYFFDVTGNIADRRVKLGEGDGEVGHVA